MNVLTSVSRTPIYSMEDYPAEKTNHYTLTRNNKQTCKSCGGKKKLKESNYTYFGENKY